MYVASEDVTGALHAATRRLRLKYRSTALESPVTYLHLESVTFALGCSHQTMHSETNAQQSRAPVFICATFHQIKSISKKSISSAEATCQTSPSLHVHPAEHNGHLLRLDDEVTGVACHLLDAAVSRAGDLVAAEGAVDADEDARL
jgi:hypothetical protein